MVNNNNVAANNNTKPCQNCGEPTAIGAIACSPCQKEWQLQWRKSHEHLFTRKAI